MRVAEQNSYLNFLRDLQSTQQEMQQIQLRLASGRKILKPSDNPAGASDIVRLTGEKAESEQFLSNLNLGRSKLDATDRILDSVERMVERVRNLGLLSTGALSDPSAYLTEISGLRDQLLTSANSTYQGRFLFGGSVLSSPPFEKDSDGQVSYKGNDNTIALQVGRHSTIDTQIPGSRIFTGAVDLFATISSLVSSIEAGDRSAIDTEIRQLERLTGELSTARTRVGLQVNFADNIESELNAGKLVRERRLEDVLSADPAQTITELALAETRLQATLAVGARISQLSLFDYLR